MPIIIDPGDQVVREIYALNYDHVAVRPNAGIKPRREAASA